MAEFKTEILIVGGGMGGCAAALSACTINSHVILTEETDWLGGQLTSQAVPADEHASIETHGGTARYRQLRQLIRQYYRNHYPLKKEFKNNPLLNPGNGNVSKICCEPKIALAAIEQMLSYNISSNKLQLMLRRKPIQVDVDNDRITTVTLQNLATGEVDHIQADYILDATELGELLPLSGTEYVSGAESADETGEPHAVNGPAQPNNVQAFTWCMAVGYDSSGNHIIEKPRDYDYWRNYTPPVTPAWTGNLLNWTYPQPSTLTPKKSALGLPGLVHVPDNSYDFWSYRRLITSDYYRDPVDEVTLVNWPQNDYMDGNIIDQPDDVVQKHLDGARQLSLSLLYWMQTDAPRSDGGTGYPGLYLRPDITGTATGLAKYPYIRESRRIRADFTVTENHIGADARKGKPAEFFKDSIGVGAYHLDLHPSTGGNNYIDTGSLPFQIPLGSLIPIRMENIIPACKNIGTTHVSNGCYRLHPVEWNIGESAGLLAAFCLKKNVSPRYIRHNQSMLEAFQSLLTSQGVELSWPTQS